MDKIDKKEVLRKKRGQVSKEDISKFNEEYIDKANDELIALLKSKDSQKRTLSIYLLGEINDKIAIPYLSQLFLEEKALYTRLAISEVLANFGEDAVPSLINLLGKIGNNQEKSLPEKYFNKKSFPLPRDLATRTLTKVGKIAIPFLIEFLDKKISNINDMEIFRKEQAIDALGAIAYKYGDHRSLNSLEKLGKNELLIKNKKYIIQWKIIRACCGFKNNEKALKILFLILNNINKTNNSNNINKIINCNTDYNCNYNCNVKDIITNNYGYTYNFDNTFDNNSNNSYFYPFYWEAIRSIGQIGIVNNEVINFFDSFRDNTNTQIKLALKIAKNSLKLY
ncbi:MAG: hypothetical protein LBM26_03735 [Methanobrevibacter sp.]|jgi:hypothetical protein|nr:hypothetical protein [Methanobrevibacter sp.]